MSFALGHKNSTKKAWSSCNLLNRGSAKPIRNKRKNPRHMARVSALVFRIFKILPISIESQEQSSNLCQKLDYLMKTSFFSNIIKFSQGMHAKARFLHFFHHRIKFTTSLTMVSRSSGLLSAMSSVSATRAPSLKILEPSTR